MANEKCRYGAPFFAFAPAGKAIHIAQGCCNHWDCPKCGQKRARVEYGRIVHGVTELAAQGLGLYFITLTCRGKELSRSDALAGYGAWTNTLLTTLRKDAKKRGVAWHYAQVTELQKRGHPHSHVLTTYYPNDLQDGHVEKWVHGEKTQVPALRSEYLAERVVSAGLGSQYDISEVRDAAAASRYVAKYMFKGLDVQMPAKWKRVRYSQAFPKLPERGGGDAFVLLSQDDWDKLSGFLVVYAEDEESGAALAARWRAGDIIVKGAGKQAFASNANGCYDESE